MYPSKPRASSLLARLSRLALEIFVDGTSAASPLENDYASIVRRATSLILSEGSTENDEAALEPLDASLEAFSGLMEDLGWEWPGLHDESAFHMIGP